MYDIPELEKKWRKYKRKKIQKPLFLGLGALVLIGGISIVSKTYFADNDKTTVAQKNSNSANVQPATPAVQPQNSGIIITKTPTNGAQTNNQVAQNSANQNPLIAAKPSQPEPEPQIDLSNAKIVKPDLPKDDIRVIGFDDKKDKQQAKSDLNSVVIPKKSEEAIQEQERIAELEESFKSTQDPKDSLEIAKYYYKKGNFKKAETWAINTNNIDGDIEESWLIFAKARAKQGFRVDAIKVLQSYYDETKSSNAKELLDKLRFGKPID